MRCEEDEKTKSLDSKTQRKLAVYGLTVVCVDSATFFQEFCTTKKKVHGI